MSFNISCILIIVSIMILSTIPISCDCEASDPRFNSLTGFSQQFKNSLSNIENTQFFLAGFSGRIIHLHHNKFQIAFEGEIMSGYKLNDGNGWLFMLQPVFCLSRNLPYNFKPYVKLITGISYKTMHIDGMGMDFNFAPAGGVGMLWSGWKVMPLFVEYRIIHLSNAGLSKQNEGLNMHSIFLGRKF